MVVPEMPPEHVHWIKEAQRRALAVVQARKRQASPDELAHLEAMLAEADRMRGS